MPSRLTASPGEREKRPTYLDAHLAPLGLGGEAVTLRVREIPISAHVHGGMKLALAVVLPAIVALAAGCGSPPPAAMASSAKTDRSDRSPTTTPSTPEEPNDNLHCGNDAASCATKGAIALVSSNAKAEGRAMLEKACSLGSQNGCTNLGRALNDGAGGPADPKRAATLWEKGCAAGDGEACNAFGIVTVDRDPPAARKALERGCMLESRDGCANFALMVAKGEGGARDDRAAATASEKACKSRQPLGCLVFGLMARDGKGTPKDRKAAKAAFHVACEGGRSEGCDAERRIEMSSDDDAPKGNTMTAENMTVDGMKLESFSCDLSKGGPLALLGIAGSIRARKAQLDACSPTTTKTTVTLRATNGRFTAVEATGGAPGVRKCVERALASQPTVFDGTCTTTIVHGRK